MELEPIKVNGKEYNFTTIMRKENTFYHKIRFYAHHDDETILLKTKYTKELLDDLREIENFDVDSVFKTLMYKGIREELKNF